MQSTNGEFHGKSVLLVDDEEDVRDAIELLMSQGLGMLVTSAGNGDGALELYRSGRFDYVVTDYNMPGQRGDALAGAIKQLNPAQRVVMISGFSEVIPRDGRLPACIDALVPKPCSLSHLVEALRGETRQA